jgi:radical SAM/Cys-rich protein
MHRLHGVTFNRLYTMTNMPISRFLQFLLDSGNLQAYMDRLTAAFNPDAIDGLMCRHTLSVAWDGRLYDCDFNQMLEIGTVKEGPQTIFDVKPATPAGRQIAVGPHCFGCTAGSGSSCGGATT